jgi:ankyrin repeat protein
MSHRFGFLLALVFVSIAQAYESKGTNNLALLIRMSADTFNQYIKNNSAISLRDEHGNTLMHHLARESNKYTYYQNMDDLRRKADILINSGIDLAIKNKFEETAFDLAQSRVKSYKLNYTQPSAILVTMIQQAQMQRKK